MERRKEELMCLVMMRKEAVSRRRRGKIYPSNYPSSSAARLRGRRDDHESLGPGGDVAASLTCSTWTMVGREVVLIIIL